MTTQWNPAGHQGEPGADGNGNGEDAGTGAQAGPHADQNGHGVRRS